MIDETRVVTTPEGEMGAVVVRPDGDGPFPVVVLFHHGPGLDAGTRRCLEMFAGEGYLAVSPDRYWRHGPFIVTDMARLRAEGRDAEVRQYLSRVAGTTEDKLVPDVTALLAHLADDPRARADRVGAVGYCIGGRTVLCAMAAHPDVIVAGVGLHPSYCVTADDASPHTVVAGLPGSLYVAFGSEDRMQSAEDNQPLIEAVNGRSDGSVAEVLDGADHGFAVPGRAYHEAAATHAYGRAFALFDKAIR